MSIRSNLMMLLALIAIISQAVIIGKEIEPKEINAEEDSLSTQTVYDVNEAETITYSFWLENKVTLKFYISPLNESETGEGALRLFRKDDLYSELMIENISLNETNYVEVEINKDEKKQYYLEYDYSTNNTVLMKFCHRNKEIYYFTDGENSLDYKKIYYTNNESFYIVMKPVDYKQFENPFNYVPIKITANFSFVDENISFAEKSSGNDFDQKKIRELINNLDAGKCDYLEKNELDNQTNIYYQNANNNYVTVLKINIPDNNFTDFKTLNISRILMNQFTQAGTPYSGKILQIKYMDQIKEIMVYSNVTPIVEIISADMDSLKEYKFGNSSTLNGNVTLLTDKLTRLNNFNESEVTLLVIADPKEDYFVNTYAFENSDDFSVNNYPERAENLTFLLDNKVYKDSSLYIFNNYLKNDEKFVQFVDCLIPFAANQKLYYYNMDFLSKIISQNAKYANPMLTTESVDLIQANGEVNYPSNVYLLKCDNHNNETLNAGDFIQICLEPDEETNITMPVSNDTDFKLTLKLTEDNENENHTVLFKANGSQEYELLDSAQKEFKGKWNYSDDEQINIKNVGNDVVLLYLRIAANKSEIIFVNDSVDKIQIKPNTLYALALPKESATGELKGVYQELVMSSNVSDLSVFHDFVQDDFFTLPPNVSFKTYAKGSYEFNITNQNIYNDVSYQGGVFYTFVYYRKGENDSANLESLDNAENSTISANSANVDLYYKKIVYYKTLQSGTIIDNGKDIRLYFLANRNAGSHKLFVEIIKKVKNQKIQASILSSYNNNLTEIDSIDTTNKIQVAKMINFTINSASDILLKMSGNGESMVLFEIRTLDEEPKFKLNYIQNNLATGHLKDHKRKKYIINLKPLETDGKAKYIIRAFDSNYFSMEDLRNPLYILNNTDKLDKNDHEKKVEYNDITSVNGEFKTKDKNAFSIDLNYLNRKVYYIQVMAQRSDSPKAYKFYYPFSTEVGVIYSNETSLEDVLETTQCYEFNITEGEKLNLTIHKIDNETKKDGALVIQYENDALNNTPEIYIYKNIEENFDDVHDFDDDEHSYTLDTRLVDDSFELSYMSRDPNETYQRFCFEFVPYEGKDDYLNNSEIEYEYFTNVTLPYFVNASNFSDLEMFRFKYNNSDVNSLKINVICTNNKNEVTSNEEFDETSLKDFNDTFYYLGVFVPEETANISLYVNVILSSNSTNMSSFIIQRYVVEDLSNNETKQNFTANDTPQFYFINLKKRLEQNDSLLLYTNLLENDTLTLHKGNPFSKNSEKVSKKFYSFTLSDKKGLLSATNGENDLLTFILHSKNPKNGTIDLATKINQTFVTDETCDRNSTYNKNITLTESHGEFYKICYYDKEKNKKYKFNYSLNSTNSSADVDVYYLNNFDNLKSIDDILNNFGSKKINSNESKILEGETEIFGYNYTNDNDTPIVFMMKANEYNGSDHDNGDDDNGSGKKKSNFLAISLISLCIIIFIIILVILLIRKSKNPSSKEIEKKVNDVDEKPLVEEMKQDD